MEPFEGMSVTLQPGGNGLVAHELDVLMPGPAQRHDEVPGLVDLAGVHIGERRTGTEVGSGRPRRA